MAGFNFRRQVIIEPYIVDFACFEAGLVIEADGGQHVDNPDEDRLRTEHLERLGYTVARFWDDEILTDTEAVLAEIYRVLIDTPSPQPSPSGRGG